MAYNNLHFSITVYSSGGLVDMIQKATDESMQSAVAEVKSLPHYGALGEVSVLLTFTLNSSV